ncbi:hypothetical protein [Geodermatophilus sp. URMC 65]
MARSVLIIEDDDAFGIEDDDAFGEVGEVTVDVPVSAEGRNPTPPFDFPDDDPDQDPPEDGTSTSPPTT